MNEDNQALVDEHAKSLETILTSRDCCLNFPLLVEDWLWSMVNNTDDDDYAVAMENLTCDVGYEVTGIWASDMDDLTVDEWAVRGVCVSCAHADEANRLVKGNGYKSMPAFDDASPDLQRAWESVNDSVQGTEWNHMDHLNRLDPEQQAFIAILALTHVFAGGVR